MNGLVIPHSSDIAKSPLSSTLPPLSQMFILPSTPGSMGLNPKTIDEEISVSATAPSSSASDAMFIELYMALSAIPASSAYLAPATLASAEVESIMNGASDTSPTNSRYLTIASGV